MKKTVQTKANKSLAIIPPTVSKLSEKELIKRIKESGSKSDNHYQHAVAFSILQGIYLAHAKETIVHGNFKKWIQENFPEISYETANRNRKLAVAIRQHVSKNGACATFDPKSLVALPRLGKAKREAILKDLETLTDGCSLRQLYHDYEVTRRPDPKGGKKVTVAEEELSEEQKQEQLELALVEDWQQFAATSLDYIADEDKSWTGLPKVERENLIGILEPFVKQLKSSLK